MSHGMNCILGKKPDNGVIETTKRGSLTVNSAGENLQAQSSRLTNAVETFVKGAQVI